MPGEEKKVGAKIFAALQRIEAEQKRQAQVLEDIKREVSGDLDLDENEGEDGKEEE